MKNEIVLNIADIGKEIQRIQFDLEERKDVKSAISRLENLDVLIHDIEEGEIPFEITSETVKRIG